MAFLSLVCSVPSRDTAGVESDVDVCVKTRTPNPFVLVHIKEDIEKLVRKHVDIVRVRDGMSPFLKAQD